MSVQSFSWKATVLQKLDPTLIKHICTKVIKVFRITVIFWAGVLGQFGAKLCRLLALQDQDWTILF